MGVGAEPILNDFSAEKSRVSTIALLQKEREDGRDGAGMGAAIFGQGGETGAFNLQQDNGTTPAQHRRMAPAMAFLWYSGTAARARFSGCPGQYF